MTALADLLTPRAQGGDRFLFPPRAGAEGRLFGGQALGQALAGALATIAPDRIAHSLHAHFLRTGDANHDNIVDVADLALLIAAFDADPSASNWDERVDFDMNQIVDVIDLSYIIANFDAEGDA